MIDILNFFTGITLSEIILCLISGYIFVGVFEYIASRQFIKDYNQNILKYILVGYILILIYHLLPNWTKNDYVNLFIFWISCILLSYACARFYISKKFVRLSELLNIYKTPNKFIWNSITFQTDSVIWVRCLFYELDLDIIGQLVECEEYQRYPQILLTCYKETSLDGKEIVNHQGDVNEQILIDVGKADSVEITYDKI